MLLSGEEDAASLANAKLPKAMTRQNRITKRVFFIISRLSLELYFKGISKNCLLAKFLRYAQIFIVALIITGGDVEEQYTPPLPDYHAINVIYVIILNN